MKHLIATTALAACLAALVPGTAYAAKSGREEHMEATLSAAGFRSIPINSPEVAQIVATTPMDKLRAEPAAGAFNYVFVDPVGCGCVLEGNEAAYQQYQALDIQQRNAELNSTAAYGRLLPPDVGFGTWGWDAPYGYGPFGFEYGPYGYGNGFFAPLLSLQFGGHHHR